MFFKYFKDVIRQGWEKWVEGKKSWEEDSRVISKIENPQIVLLILLELPLGTLRYQKKFQLDM